MYCTPATLGSIKAFFRMFSLPRVALIVSKTLGLQPSRSTYKEMDKESWSHQNWRVYYYKIQDEKVATILEPS